MHSYSEYLQHHTAQATPVFKILELTKVGLTKLFLTAGCDLNLPTVSCYSFTFQMMNSIAEQDREALCKVQRLPYTQGLESWRRLTTTVAAFPRCQTQRRRLCQCQQKRRPCSALWAETRLLHKHLTPPGCSSAVLIIRPLYRPYGSTKG